MEHGENIGAQQLTFFYGAVSRDREVWAWQPKATWPGERERRLQTHGSPANFQFESFFPLAEQPAKEQTEKKESKEKESHN